MTSSFGRFIQSFMGNIESEPSQTFQLITTAHKQVIETNEK